MRRGGMHPCPALLVGARPAAPTQGPHDGLLSVPSPSPAAPPSPSSVACRAWCWGTSNSRSGKLGRVCVCDPDDVRTFAAPSTTEPPPDSSRTLCMSMVEFEVATRAVPAGDVGKSPPCQRWTPAGWSPLGVRTAPTPDTAAEDASACTLAPPQHSHLHHLLRRAG